MTSAKQLVLMPIPSRVARDFVRRHHYSGKVANNSSIHMGIMLNGIMVGAMQLGPPLDKSKLIGLVKGTKWHDMLELNRMVLLESAPRNSESRSIAMAMRIIRKHKPNIEWVVSFADATQCGDGTIYRAAGFTLTGIKRSTNLASLPTVGVIHKMTLESAPTRRLRWIGNRSYFDVTGGKYDFRRFVSAMGGEVLPGFQLRYVYFLNEAARSRLSVPEIPYSALDEIGCRMYRGKRAGSIDDDALGDQPREGGSIPTPALHPNDRTA